MESVQITIQNPPPSNVCFDLTNYLCVRLCESPSTLKRLPRSHKFPIPINLTTPLSGTGYAGLCSQQRKKGRDRGRDRKGERQRDRVRGGEGERINERG